MAVAVIAESGSAGVLRVTLVTTTSTSEDRLYGRSGAFLVFPDLFPLDTLNTTLEGLTVLVDVAGHYPTPLVLVVVTRVTRKTPAEPPPAAACPCPLERPRPAGR